jgi:hypothetical protein
MERMVGWARVWFAAKREEDEAQLRNGAWYPVVSSGEHRVVLDVSGERVAVPAEVVELRDKRPDRFTVVYRAYDDPNPARGTRGERSRRGRRMGFFVIEVCTRGVGMARLFFSGK